MRRRWDCKKDVQGPLNEVLQELMAVLRSLWEDRVPSPPQFWCLQHRGLRVLILGREGKPTAVLVSSSRTLTPQG